ncbi:MAG: nickel-dependent hydrogenase large subunit [Clostridiales Family XIII bacterium]|jgi:ech hydrogenase subunit E|nr:nickel-dependent hydrogenase large subunit [Clostridiales Family XIII bacterium]
MGKRTIIPFGPQHPVLPEPVHLDLVLEDEKVIEAIPQIGYVHRGLEKLTEKREFTELVYVIERVCGICSFGHGLGYCMSVEENMKITIPKRAELLRTLLHELARVHSHLLWLGLLADSFGFESLFMHSWRLRETVLDLLEEATGGRIIFSICKIGGLHHDLSNDMVNKIVLTLDGMLKELKELTDVFLDDFSVKKRLVNLGKLSPELAAELGAVGPFAKASGLDIDMRSNGHAGYKYVKFKTITDDGGDSYARAKVRIGEIYQSIDIIKQVANILEDGTIAVPVKGTPAGKAISRLEQPRGEAFYISIGDGTKHLKRFRVRTPTNANIPAMLEVLKGVDLADVPLIILTIDPCISCTER